MQIWEDALPSRIMVSRELAELLKLLAHPDRLRLIEELRLGEQDVGGIAAALNLPATRISQHLAQLRSARLVEDRREGRNHFYRLTHPGIAAWIVEALEFVEVRHRVSDSLQINEVRELWTTDTPAISR
jgi:DNA-binding transcriptional ArsR family regulator